MGTGINLNSKRHDYTGQIVALLQLLSDGPKLASELPKWPSAIIEAESQSLAKAECLERHNGIDAPSRWQWRITPKGKRWLAKQMQPAQAATSKRSKRLEHGHV